MFAFRSWLARSLVATGLFAFGLFGLPGLGSAQQPATDGKPTSTSTNPQPDLTGSLGAEFVDTNPTPPVPYVLPPAGWPHVDFAHPDPLIDRPYSAQPGWYTDLDVNGFFSVQLTNHLNIPVNNTITGNIDNVNFAGNKLDPTVSPRLTVGYALEDGHGGFQVSARFLNTRGSDTLVTGDNDAVQAPGYQSGRLEFYMFDFDYVSHEYALDPNWDMRWTAGLRFASLFFDSGVNFISPGTAPGSILAQYESNSLQNYGVHGILDLSRKLPVRGLSAFFRGEAMGSYARNTQTSRETVAGNPGDVAQVFQTRFTADVGEPMVGASVGLSYTIPEWNYSRVMLGYVYEQWFYVARDINLNSTAFLQMQGVYLRAEINF
jgi:hypothetical protein